MKNYDFCRGYHFIFTTRKPDLPCYMNYGLKIKKRLLEVEYVRAILQNTSL